VIAESVRVESKPPRVLFLVWLKAAGQGVGGAGTSQLSAYNDLVIARLWMDSDEWAECWAICQLAPGVTTIAMALLTGARLGRASGAAASMAGLVAPSLFITVLLTVFAAAVAATLVNSWRLGKPVVRTSAVQGPAVLTVALLVAAGSAALILTTDIPVFALLLGGGAVMAATMWVAHRLARNSDR
jgi:chromate transport protein ChrA